MASSIFRLPRRPNRCPLTVNLHQISKKLLPRARRPQMRPLLTCGNQGLPIKPGENRPVCVTGRLRHPPDEETEPSGSVWLIEGLRLGRGSVFTPLEQAHDPRLGIGGRRACALDLAGWRHLHPARTPVWIGVASVAVYSVADDLLLDFGGVAGAALRERFRSDVSDHGIELVPENWTVR